MHVACMKLIVAGGATALGLSILGTIQYMGQQQVKFETKATDERIAKIEYLVKEHGLSWEKAESVVNSQSERVEKRCEEFSTNMEAARFICKLGEGILINDSS